MRWWSKSKARLRREAADWLARMRGEPSFGDRARFKAWYEADRSHAEAYDRLAATWDAAALLPRRLASAPANENPATARKSPVPYALAAVLVACLALGTLLLGSRLLAPDPEPRPLLLATSIGELREFRLPDGSRVTLDTDSAIAVRLSADARTLELQRGRARFHVAAEDRPFIVRAGLGHVLATGTIFDVARGPERMSVLLLEGSVRVEAAPTGGKPVWAALQPGQKLRLAGAGVAPHREAASRTDAVWTTGMLQFDAVPLRDAIAEANRYSRRKILLATPALGHLRVTGAFRSGDAEGLARSLAAAFRLTLTPTPERHLLLSPSR